MGSGRVLPLKSYREIIEEEGKREIKPRTEEYSKGGQI
jgi:hypothetical protein